MSAHNEIVAFTTHLPVQFRGLSAAVGLGSWRSGVCERRTRFPEVPASVPVSVAAPPVPRVPVPAPVPAGGGGVGNGAEVRSATDFVRVQAAAAAAGSACYVVFHARHCRACRALAPKFLAWARERGVAAHVQVDAPGGRELASRLGVRAVPVMQVYDGAQGKIDQFVLSMAKLQQVRATASGTTTAVDDTAAAAATASASR